MTDASATAQISTSADQWTWMGGNDTISSTCTDGCGRTGVYGTLGKASAQSNPGGRQGGATWIDTNGNLWLFGGNGVDANGQTGDLNDMWKFDPSVREWAWMGGASVISCGSGVCSQLGVYGTKGKPDAANIPTSRMDAITWNDKNGHFWLFGGTYRGTDNGQSDYLNDLWEFDPATDVWTWVAGSSSVPSSSSAAGQPGVYGQERIPDPANTPGARVSSIAWIDDNGDLRLAFGTGFDVNDNIGSLTDVWKFETSIQQWTWTGGQQGGLTHCFGIYGTLGQYTNGSMPGCRNSQTGWIDSNGQLWMFGGHGADSQGRSGTLNDLWTYDLVSDTWIWMGGSKTIQCANPSAINCGDPGVYGPAPGHPDPSNYPGARATTTTWKDAKGNIWMLGGSGFDRSALFLGQLNDLWELDTQSHVWTWMSGEDTMNCDGLNCGVPGTYGILGTPSSASMPGGRSDAMSWIDSKGNLWLFGGNGMDKAFYSGYLNDLWVYEAVEPLPETAKPTFNLAAGTYTAIQTLTISDSTPGATIYYTTDGHTPNSSSSVYGGPITISTTETIQALAVASGYSNSAIIAASFVINLPPSFNLDPNSTSLSINSGSQGSTTLTVTPQNGFSSAVTFACSGLPAGTTCTFNPATVTPSGKAATTQLTIAASSSASNVMPSRYPLLPASTLALAGGLLLWRRRRALACWSAAVFLSAGLLMISACGGGGSSGGGNPPPPPPPTAATITVTASSGALQQTTTIALTINH